MPTNLNGLLLFLVLLLPGFAYTVGRERAGVERKVPPLRETVSIVVASVACELVVLLVFAVIRITWPHATPDVGKIVRGEPYFKTHYALIATWGVLLLGTATALAYASTRPALRRRFTRVDYPHPSTASAWWIVFEKWKPRSVGAEVRVACYLDDGSYVAGRVKTFNNAAEDTADRDLVLLAPIEYRHAPTAAVKTLDAGAVVISARRIQFMAAKHWAPRPPGSEGQPSDEAEPPSTTGGTGLDGSPT